MGPDGEALYIVTDRDADTRYLARLDVSDGSLSVVARGGEHEIDGVAIHQESQTLVYSRNVEGYTELSLAELTGPADLRRLPMPTLPGGIAGGVSFDPTGDRFALSASSRVANTNVHLVDLAALRDRNDEPESGGKAIAAGVVDGAGTDEDVARWTRASTAGIPTDTFVDPELVHYESFDGLEVPALFSQPHEIPTGGAPVIVDVHGGPESQRRPGFAAVTQYFLSRGYALLEPNVRGSSGYGRAYASLDDVEKRMDAVADLAAAHEWGWLAGTTWTRAESP